MAGSAIKQWLRSVFQYLWVQAVILKNRLFQLTLSKTGLGVVWLDLTGLQLGRYLYVYTYFLAQDRKVYLTVDYDTLKKLSDYSEWIPNEPNIFLTTKTKGNQQIHIKDPDRDQSIEISFDCFSGNEGHAFRFPYFMHPGFYRFKHIKDLSSLRQMDRPLKVFFVGGFERETYDLENLGSKFGMPNRWESVQYLKKNRDDLYIPETLAELDSRLTTTKIPGVTLVDTSKFFIMQPQLQRYYGRSSFHLSLPGVVMPMCHNVIEAMVVGCIPILSYPHLFSPPLEHGKNCLVYKDLDELNSVLNSVDSFTNDDLVRMRDEVLEYYDSFIEVSSLRRNFEKFLSGSDRKPKKVLWNVEHLSVDQYKAI